MSSWIASTGSSEARKLQGTVRERCFEGTLDSFSGDVESATVRDDALEVLRLLAIGVSIQNSLNERVQGVDREAVDSKGFADSVVGNAGSHAELVISVGMATMGTPYASDSSAVLSPAWVMQSVARLSSSI